MTKVVKAMIAGFVFYSSTRPLHAFAPSSVYVYSTRTSCCQPSSSVVGSKRSNRYNNYEEDDEDFLLDTRTFERSRQEEELRTMRMDDELIDYESDEVFEEVPVDTDALATGNFWSNPEEGLDIYPDRPSRRSRRPLPPSTATPPHQSRRRRQQSRDSDGGLMAPSIFGDRTTFRSGTPPPPNSIKELYDRLFWYGFDPDVDNSSPEGFDKTVFGGTKGKFDGLSYLDESDGAAPQQSSRRRRRTRSMDFEEDGEFVGEDEETRGLNEDRILRNTEQNEKLDFPRHGQRMSEPTEPTGRPSRNEYYDDLEEESQGPNVQDSQWRNYWEGDKRYVRFNEDENKGDGVRERRRERAQQQNPFTGFLDDVFNVDRDKMDYKAEAYNRQLGRSPVGTYTWNQAVERRPRSTSDYQYRYEGSDERDSNYIVEFDSSEDKFENEESFPSDVVVDVDAEVDEVTPKNQNYPSRKKRTRDERSLAYELVPPAGVAAWGPSGDLGFDARTKATLDALEDIRNAKRKVGIKSEKVQEAKEDITIIRADAELTKKRASREDPRRIRAQLLQIELQLEDAARFLRQARNEEEQAKQEMENLEDRHWALLSLYDVDKASQEVVNAFEELYAGEPVTRLNNGIDSEFANDWKTADVRRNQDLSQ